MKGKETNYKKFIELENKLLRFYIIITILTAIMIFVEWTQFILFSGIARLSIMIFLLIKYIEYKEKEKAIVLWIIMFLIAVPINNEIRNILTAIIVYPSSIILFIRTIIKNKKIKE